MNNSFRTCMERYILNWLGAIPSGKVVVRHVGMQFAKGRLHEKTRTESEPWICRNETFWGVLVENIVRSEDDGRREVSCSLGRQRSFSLGRALFQERSSKKSSHLRVGSFSSNPIPWNKLSQISYLARQVTQNDIIFTFSRSTTIESRS
jgi:hypothetical protein